MSSRTPVWSTLACRVSGNSARLAIFVVYFWFGALKLLGASPASPLVGMLLEQVAPGVSPSHFLVGLGGAEMLIGASFLAPRLSQWSFLAIGGHLVATAGPLLLLPHVTWAGFLLPSLEGQYILKNLLIVSAVLCLAGSACAAPSARAGRRGGATRAVPPHHHHRR